MTIFFLISDTLNKYVDCEQLLFLGGIVGRSARFAIARLRAAKPRAARNEVTL